MGEQGVVVAERLVMQRFPEARAAWLGGSVAAGEQTSTSDLDITVLLDGPPAPFRSSEVLDGWPVEFFVQTEESLLHFCAQDRGRRRPTTMRLVGSSIILIDRDGSGRRLQAAMHQLDLDGPPSATDPDLESQRYAITDMLADMAAARSDDEMLIVAAALTWAVGDFVLAANRRWSGSGKWLLREIVALDHVADTRYAPSLTGGLRAAAAGDPKRLHGVALAILKEFGGPVFDGFHRRPPPETVTALGGFQVQPMTEHDAHRVAAWRYDGRWSIYDLSSAQPILEDLVNYFAVTSGERLVGFCCVGEAARVPGLTADPAVVDIGLGMEPDLVGHGHGVPFGQAVLTYLTEAYPEKQFRAVIQAWNERSLNLVGRLGFDDAGEWSTIQGGHPVGYRILKRPIRSGR
ncbi:nucleotidyltransferase domain-containing protein [Mycolicibacterium sp. YH-1]|uniref:nucleotidyltransferase domain-containing protein n=1 Tax=Mycolicibacterium sp. YH-1 TaxID=2908837 RepID=UPI001F4C1329|nr:nucleotidyltransferase domain-containing protein [Mycolicibacterium sp. YH-1]UNB52892.1 nucleotidyltransferase domain-containing protein [Mycolicibacterium sp. YH-1]